MPAKLLISFVAGLLGFLSPCVLPLLPGYAAYMTGASSTEPVPIRKALPGTLAFVGGLAVVFISLGASASLIAGVLHEHKRGIEIAAGIFIVAMGVFMALGPRIGALGVEKRFHVRPGIGVGRVFLLGAAFAFGWTPCIGPTLGAALNLAATADGLGRGIALLAAYSAGLGLPFALAGLGLLRVGRKLRERAAIIQTVGGVILIGVGVLVLTGQLTLITRAMQGALTRLGLDFWNV